MPCVDATLFVPTSNRATHTCLTMISLPFVSGTYYRPSKQLSILTAYNLLFSYFIFPICRHSSTSIHDDSTTLPILLHYIGINSLGCGWPRARWEKPTDETNPYLQTRASFLYLTLLLLISCVAALLLVYKRSENFPSVEDQIYRISETWVIYQSPSSSTDS